MRISLITACKDSAVVIPDNLSSVKGQTGDFELEHLFQDGGSSDGTLEQVDEYKDSVDYDVSIISGQDKGFYDAINRGIERSTGDVIGLLNADDFLADEGVLASVHAAFVEDPELDVVYGDLDFVEEARGERLEARGSTSEDCGEIGRVGGKRLMVNGPSNKKPFKVTRRWKSGAFSPEKFRRGWVPPHPTIYMRRRVFEKVGDYRLDFGTSADYEHMLRVFVVNNFNVHYLPKVMVNMRLGGQSTESLKNRLIANKNDGRAWDVNGLKPSPFFRIVKPLRKVFQWL